MTPEIVGLGVSVLAMLVPLCLIVFQANVLATEWRKTEGMLAARGHPPRRVPLTIRLVESVRPGHRARDPEGPTEAQNGGHGYHGTRKHG